MAEAVFLEASADGETADVEEDPEEPQAVSRQIIHTSKRESHADKCFFIFHFSISVCTVYSAMTVMQLLTITSKYDAILENRMRAAFARNFVHYLLYIGNGF